MLRGPELRVCSWLYLTPSPSDSEALCVGGLDVLAVERSETGIPKGLVLKGQAGWLRAFRCGPFPSAAGAGALGTGLGPSTIKGPGGANKLQSLGGSASFLANPFNDGKCFSKDFCHSEKGDFPPAEGGWPVCPGPGQSRERTVMAR